MFLNNRKSCSSSNEVYIHCSLALGFLFTLQELVFFYLLPCEALKCTDSKWELGRSGTVSSSAHPVLRWWLGAVRGLPWEANTGAAVLFDPSNSKGNRGWSPQNYNTGGTGRRAEAGQVLHRYVEISACSYFWISPVLFSFGVLRGKEPHTRSFAYAALCNHFMPPLDTCTFNSLLGHRMQTFECTAGEIFLFLFISH